MNQQTLPISLDEQRSRIEKLSHLVAERVRSEAGLRASLETREATLLEQFTGERQRLLARHQSERAAAQSQHSTDLTQITRDYEIAVETALKDHDREYRSILSESEQAAELARSEWEAAQQRCKAELVATVQGLQQILREFRERIEERRLELRQLDEQAFRIVRRRRCHRAAQKAPEKQGICDPNAPLDSYLDQVAESKKWLEQFSHQPITRFLNFGSLIVVFLSIWLLMSAIGTFISRLGWPWITASGVVAAGSVAIIYVVLRPILVRQTLDTYDHFRQAIANADIALDTAMRLRAAEADTKRIASQQQCDLQLRKVTLDHQKTLEELTATRESRLKETAERLQANRKLATETRDSRQKAINQRFSQSWSQLQEVQTAQIRQADERQQAETAASREMHDRGWQRVVARWQEGVADFQSAVDRMWEYCDQRFPPWNDLNEQSPPVVSDSLPALRFGKFAFSLRSIDGGAPTHDDLIPPRVDFVLPAVLSFATRPSLLLEAWGDGRSVATKAMQNVMLRLLTSLPPGKVRFTIIDPVGLGQNFAAFMHLADFDEKLITHRIWTETQHINQRLLDLTEHMEDVLQTYLRNEFPTIDEYNQQAGEVAEPFHVLVVANFPAGFSDEAAQRLLSIMHTGARCGVYSIISTDSKLDFPRNFDLADLEAHAATVQWNGQRFGWRDETLKDLPLMLDEPPEADRLTQLIRVIGARAKDAIRVEIPFATVACPDDSWWTQDSRGGIEIALGRAGASKLQYLRLGKGTSQHVLISGKTGSGKSTLLHALITNTAIHYSPDEVEFYLIDFKKGVEFKPYASMHLPHARVIAIESEREFGMSVLERLDQELRVRGDLFRRAGVQDIKNYRDENPDQRLPRILLIIDEFQEFFTQDDKLAQEAALLLDRLIRQGRAFGIHVLLGSQTLAGAYSLARSTLGQMAVRIALQCSETDSHLILSEDNSAARLLDRPGEAIYNDANGLFEGNHPFQVVWLSGNEQADYLERIARKSQNNGIELSPAIVFEGNAPAEPAENPALRHILEHGAGADVALAPRAWVGASVAIKEPTSATFRKQSSANLLVVGQQEELALGVLASCLVSLGASFGNGNSAKFYVLDGTRPESPHNGMWNRIAEVLPLDLTVAGPNDTARIISEIEAELSKRSEAGNETESSIFLLIYNLSRFRDLRRSDDDIGFSFGGEKSASPAQQFASLLREGPILGIHSLIWCDTFNTVSRWFDRSTLRELDQRVLFQMSSNDSSNLIDSPAAARLGSYRAILFSEEQGNQEKFRPYGPPSSEWLNWVAQRLSARPGGVIGSAEK